MNGLDYLNCKFSSMYGAIKHNTFKLEASNIVNILEKMPSINKGRHSGHSTAIIKMIKNNPDLNFLILGTTLFEYDIHYKHYHNARRVNIANYNNLRGINDKFDYIIIDNFTEFKRQYSKNSRNLIDFLLMVFRYNTQNIRIIGLG